MKTRRVASPLFRPLLFLPLLPACGARAALSDGPCDPDDLPTCIADAEDDPCGPPRVVAPVCDAAAQAYVCPEGARVYARVAETPATCLPLSGLSTSIHALSGWGLGGSLVRVPTDDGRCLWIADQIQTTGGETIRNVGLEVDRHAPFGTCPTSGSLAGGALAPVVQVEGGEDPTILVQIASAYRFAGVTRVAYRLFKVDPGAVYGVTDLGGGLGRWDGAAQRIVVQGPGAVAFSTDLDLGTAALAEPDHAYVWGCPRKGGFLVSGCIVSRFDAQGTAQLLAGGGSWTSSLDPSLAVTTGLVSGPWVSSVVADPVSGGLLHVYASGFGTSLQTQTADVPGGPWTAAASIGGCALPSGDTAAYCAGPVVHEELADPTRPGEVVVSYGIGTTAANPAALMSADPEGYWTHLTWGTAP